MKAQWLSKDIVKTLFLVAATIDGAIAISWFLIASGLNIPNILNGYIGVGDDYRLAMYISAMFMAVWTIILIWGACKPYERIALLLITSSMLFLSVLAKLFFYLDLLTSGGFILGVVKRSLIATFALIIFLLATIQTKEQSKS